MEVLLSKQDVAKLMKVSVKTIDRFRDLKTNKLKYLKIKGTVRFRQLDVDDFLNKHKR